MKDPRPLHFILMGGMFLGASFYYDFSIKYHAVLVVFFACFISQFALNFITRLQTPFSIRSYYSSLITSVGISVLLRSNSLLIFAAVSFLAILSKYLIRFNDKHVFNPANFAVAIGIGLFPAWVSPGQWGVGGLVVFLISLVGMILIYRAKIVSMSIYFISFYALYLFLYKVLWVGNSFDSYLNGVLNGSFIVFSLFMISDPRTSPNSNQAKIIHCSLVALAAVTMSEVFYINNSLIWSLLFCNLLVPIWDWYFKGLKYMWNHRDVTPLRTH